MACTTDNAADPLVYRTGFQNNISSLYGSVGPERGNANDPAAPDFQWRDSTGALDSLSGQLGKIVVLNFFAKWCGPCHNEASAFQAIAQKSKDSVEVIGVAVDANGDVFQRATEFAQQHNLTFQIVADSSFRVYDAYIFAFANFSIPYTFIIGRDGAIKTYHDGAVNEEVLDAMIQRAD